MNFSVVLSLKDMTSAFELFVSRPWIFYYEHFVVISALEDMMLSLCPWARSVVRAERHQKKQLEEIGRSQDRFAHIRTMSPWVQVTKNMVREGFTWCDTQAFHPGVRNFVPGTKPWKPSVMSLGKFCFRGWRSIKLCFASQAQGDWARTGQAKVSGWKKILDVFGTLQF